jgi:hypothetical protein
MENQATTNFRIWVRREYPISLESEVHRTMSSPDKQGVLTTPVRRVAYGTVQHMC